ncbi:MAG TPA: amidase [Candidatus Eisenbacteria bacterium]|nr:amidase [Candidatus Eisenbacteria bacterium]
MSAAFLPAAELADRYARRSLSPVEVTRELLERIDRLDPQLRAWITLTPERAMDQARAAEAAIGRGEAPSPLCGVPVGIKDLIDVAGVRCTSGSRVRADHVPKRDAFVVERLARAGAVCLGKQNLHEFAYGVTSTNEAFGVCRNPWSMDRVPGGSSGGAGVALAAGMTPLAIGTDTGGSIRIPAAACGVVGLKPTFGLVSRRGVFPLAWSLDHVGPMARTVADAAALLAAIAVHDPEDPWCAEAPTEGFAGATDLRGRRFGLLGAPLFADAEPVVASAVEEAAGTLESLGALRVDLDTASLQHAYTAFHAMLATEASAIHERTLRERPREYSALTRQALARGFMVSAVDYVHARREQARVQRSLERMLEEAEVLIAPSLPRTAPPIGEPMSREPAEAWNRWMPPFNLSGHPALSLPCGFDREGLPIGLQIVGRAFEDGRVLGWGAAYERETDWNQRRPAGFEREQTRAVDL